MGGFPNLEGLLSQWWGCGVENFGFAANIDMAANVVFGNNPPFQISDFLAIYPKFGSYSQGISVVGIAVPGIGYTLNDLLGISQPDASGASFKVTAVDGNGAVTGLTIVNGGTGYSLTSNVATTGGTGTGAKINITALQPFVGVIPQTVLQMYINLASASLVQARWLDSWQIGMAFFVAHFATLYLRSEGNPGTTAQQIAASGLEKGIIVSASAGDVSKGLQVVDGLDGWAMWTQTTFGTQLATLGKIIGLGPMWIY